MANCLRCASVRHGIQTHQLGVPDHCKGPRQGYVPAWATVFSPNKLSHPYPLAYTPLCSILILTSPAPFTLSILDLKLPVHVSADSNMLSFVHPRTLSLARVGSLSSFRRACDGAGRMMVLRVLDFHLAVSCPWRCVWQAIGHHS